MGQGTGRIRLSETPTKVDRPKQKLAIMKRSDYPGKAGFPDSLTWLQVQSCKLRKIDQRILRLVHLQVLDLAHNSIKEIPLALGQIKLKELIMHHNELTTFPPELAKGNLGQNLQVLDLSFNKVSFPPFLLIVSSNIFCFNFIRISFNNIFV